MNHSGAWGTSSHHTQAVYPISSIPTSLRGKLSLKGAKRHQVATALGPRIWHVMLSLWAPEEATALTMMGELHGGRGSFGL